MSLHRIKQLVVVAAALAAVGAPAALWAAECTIKCARCTMNLDTHVWHCEDCTITCP